MTTCYEHGLKSLIADGSVALSQVDEAVMRVLKLKDSLGLFDNPFRALGRQRESLELLSPENMAVSEKLAGESIVLLKNKDSLLPLNTEGLIGFIGPFVNSHDLLGSWSWRGSQSAVETLAEVISRTFDNAVIAQKSFDIPSPSQESVGESISEAVGIARASDVVVLMLGEASTMSGEAASRSSIKLPQSQIDLVDQVCAVNPNVVVVLFNGRPLDLSDIEPKVSAIVEAWFPGTRGAQAVVSLLTGKVNPSAKLTMSFPRSVGQVPIFYDHDNTGRPASAARTGERYVSKYLDVENTPLFQFGFGLSYSRFVYGDAEVSPTEFDADTPLNVRVRVANESDVDGAEIVQLYIRDIVADVERPVKELVCFERVDIPARQSRVVEFELHADDFAYAHRDLTTRADKGDFDIMVGSSSEDVCAPLRVRLV
jgi:beta-glucosidase